MEERRQKSWFARNWPWVVPAGGCLVVICVFFFFVGSMFFGLTSMLKESGPYQTAVELASENDEVIQLLGEPLEMGTMMKGNINYNNGDGKVHFSIPISGSKSSGDVLVIGTKTGDADWVYETLEVSSDDSTETINLLETTGDNQ
jgi:hypothetical protein